MNFTLQEGILLNSIVSVLIAIVLTTTNLYFAIYLAKKAYQKSKFEGFNKFFISSMMIRNAFLLLLFVLIVTVTGVNLKIFTISFFLSNILIVFIEIFYLNKILPKLKISSKEKTRNQ